ncbi:TraE/TraK family type IV conjugative transfer system protein [Thorsellia kenyensis]|uniref:TraE/TraK family type IV conjugative transfer system protein n=1 Tax=Thorsellia kenyensis TaxID=1549888 RepID=A0ABV6CDA7_9GAMM
MRYDLFTKKYLGVIEENKIFKIVLILELIIILFLTIQNFHQKSIVTFIPPTLNEQANIEKYSASSEYLTSLALYFSGLVGNVTPGNVSLIESALSPMLSPGIYQHVMDVLHMQSQQIKNDRVTLSFGPRQVEHDVENGKIYVTGYSIVSGIAGESSRELRTYEFEIKIQNFMPIVMWMSTYQGQPRK